MAHLKLSVETDDPEIFLKALVLAAHALDMSPLFADAVNSESSDPCLSSDLHNGIESLTTCANKYAQYKAELYDYEQYQKDAASFFRELGIEPIIIDPNDDESIQQGLNQITTRIVADINNEKTDTK